MVWQAFDSLLPAAYSPLYRAGLTGEVFRGAGRPLLAGDLTQLLIPGLAALGIDARLTPLPPEGTEWEPRPSSTGRALLFGFAAPLEFSPPDEIDDSTPLPAEADPEIAGQALCPDATVKRLFRQDAQGPAACDETAALRTRFSHVLFLRRSVKRELRRDSVRAALHRWLAWHAAYPERAPREADLTEPSCGPAADFLREVVGTRRDFVSNRLRYAAECFDLAQVENAYRWLQEAGLAAWQLPAAISESLCAAPERPLSDRLRRELIYLARAGTPTLKTLATRRLTHERHHLDARKTLHQLCFDHDPWVRAAARPISA